MAKNKKNTYKETTDAIETKVEKVQNEDIEAILEETNKFVEENTTKKNIKKTKTIVGNVIIATPRKTVVNINGNGYTIKGCYNVKDVEIEYNDEVGFEIVSVKPIG